MLLRIDLDKLKMTIFYKMDFVRDKKGAIGQSIGVLNNKIKRKPNTLSFQNFVYMFYINLFYRPVIVPWQKCRK